MKNLLREKAKEIRKSLPVIELSKKIIENLYSLEEYKNSKNILCYYPLKYEIITTPCLSDKLKTWYLPRVNGLDLEICRYNKNLIKKGFYNIYEPINSSIEDLSIIDMIIIPAVAADRNGYRLGYGKGYYDRFLSNKNIIAKKVVLVYSELLYDNVYPEKYDKKCDILITDKEILRT